MKRIVIPAPSFIVSVMLVTGCGGKEEHPITEAPVKVAVQQVQNTVCRQELSYSGSIEPDNTAQVGFAVAGVVNDVAVQEGQFVRQGQLLAGIDATEYSNALAIADAGLDQAEDLYRRLNELYQKGSLPAKDYIDIKTKVAQAKANKEINAKHIADSRLYAPMSGIITAKLVVKGSTAAPGIPAFTIVKTDKVFARVSVPESEVGSLRKGMPATIFIPTMRDSLKGEISIINPQADAASKTYAVKVQLSNGSGRLLPGMIANVQVIPGTRETAITIPATAVVRDADDLTYVFVVSGENKAIRRRILAGRVTGMEEITVTGGLKEGDRIVTTGQTRLKDGSTITF